MKIPTSIRPVMVMRPILIFVLLGRFVDVSDEPSKIFGPLGTFGWFVYVSN